LNLIYLVAVGAADPRFYECVQWSVHSLRQWGRFTGDILILTDNASPSLFAAVQDYANVFEVDADALFDAAHQRSDHDKFQVTRLLIHQLLDLSAYETVMYMDADILAVQNVNSLFEGVNEFRYSREFQPMSAPMFSDLLTDEELSHAKWRRAINSGVYLAPANYLPECLNAWKAILDANPDVHCYDQTALNTAVFRDVFRAKPLATFSVGYPVLAYFGEHYRPQTQLLHYCGNRRTKFARMRQHYLALVAGEPLQLHFDCNEGIEATLGDVDLQRPCVRTTDEKRPRWIISIDDRAGIESHALVNQQYALALEARGHIVISLDEAKKTKPDVVIHHNYTTDFLSNTFIEGVPHIAVRTSDFGPHPSQWVAQINGRYQQLWVHSEWTRKNALSGGVEPHRVRVMPHGIDTTVFTPKGTHYNLPTDKSFRFLFVGGAAIRKGIDILLKAYAQAFGPDDDVSLIIKDSSANVFYKDNQYRNKIIQMAQDSNLPEIIHLDEHLSAEDLAALYRACTVGVWPYRGEGFLIPALECEGCGTPTMLPTIGPTIDFSTDRTSFLVPAVDVKLPVGKSFRMRLGFEIDVESIHLCEIKPEVLAKHMRLAFETSQETFKSKSASCIVKTHGNFTWSQTADLMEKFISELIDTTDSGEKGAQPHQAHSSH
jgi:glycosyltransferase involved in cell wall biosynthesis